MGVDPFVVIEAVTKTFLGMKEPALNTISAVIEPGKMMGLVGPDGAGKTTLIRLMTGLMHPDSGHIKVGGFDTITQAKDIHQIIGYMPQKFGLYEDLSVIENLNLYADLRHVTKEQRPDKYEKLLRFTDLERFQRRLARDLSGGMKQKLGLACALIGDPKLLLLDEPSVGVDPISRCELWHMVQELLGGGMTVVWSTSYLDEAEKCPEVVLLNEGDKLYDGPPDGMLERVKGRVFQLQDIVDKRPLLMKLLKDDDVIDGVIQGKYIRLTLRDADKKPPINQGQWVPVQPRFEDAFVDQLGGADSHSRLADQMEEKSQAEGAVIEALALTKKFGNFTAVSDNTFIIQRGEIFGLLGPNGAGKSTTFKMMCGLLQPTSGQAFVKGLDLKTASSEARNRIGYMAQKFSLYGHMNALQNLKFFSGLYGLSGSVQKEAIEEMIEVFELGEHLTQNSILLPLGFKQRLALACSVMHRPDVLFLDEPTSGVDPLTRREFWGHINGMVEKGVTIMVTTHFMDEAEYCDRVALIYRGKNIATGSPDELKELAAHYMETESTTLEEAFIALVERRDLSERAYAAHLEVE